jgi:hypothetical protein
MYIVFLRGLVRLLVIANVVPSLPIHVNLTMVAKRSSETSVRTTATLRQSQKTAFFIATTVKTSNLA